MTSDDHIGDRVTLKLALREGLRTARLRRELTDEQIEAVVGSMVDHLRQRRLRIMPDGHGYRGDFRGTPPLR